MDKFCYEKRMDFYNGSFTIKDPNYNFEDLIKSGFNYSEARGEWSTPHLPQAFSQYNFGTPRAKMVLHRYFIIERDVDTSRFDWPEGLNPYDFQLAAANFSLSRNRSYLALDPGMGKTIIAALIHNHSPGRTLAIVPSFLKYNWKREFLKWNTTKLTDRDIVTIESSLHAQQIDRSTPFIIFPDSLTDSPRAMDVIASLRFDRIFIDEAHRYKSPEAKRTRAVLGGYVEWKSGRKYIRGVENVASHVVSLSGTPMPNRPIELWPVLFSQAPETINFMNHYNYGIKYCNGHHDGYGMNFKGKSNLGELHDKVFNHYMIRMTKEQYLTDLPEKTREVIFLKEAKLKNQTKEFSRSALSKYSITEILESATGGEITLGEIAAARQDLGESKVEHAAAFIQDILNTTDEKVVVFAHHKIVVKSLSVILERYGCLRISGETDASQKDENVKLFQTDSRYRVCVVNIAAGGVGITLTAGTRAIFVEYDWVPANNLQAEDRLHRIGQKDNVFCQYLVVENTLDQAILEGVFNKMDTIKELGL